MDNNKANGYIFTKQWFEFVDENPEKIKPTHAALWHYLVELNNKLKWKEKFGVPTDYTMRMIGVKNYKTYKNTLNDLIKWGFIQMVTKSSNQYNASVIALVKFTKPNTKASPKQVQSTVDIDKQYKPLETSINSLNPKKADSNFLIFDFQEEYKNANGITYVLKEEDYSAARQLSEIYRKETGITDQEELRTSLKEYFKTVIQHPDNFHRTRMTLAYLVKNINVINNTLTNGKHGATWQELKNIFKHPNKLWEKQESSFLNVSESLSAPSAEQVIKYFEENGSTKIEAEKFFDACAYLKKWKDNAGFSFIEKWKDYATNYIKKQ